MLHSLIFPMSAHVGLTALIYALLTAARAPAVWGLGTASDGTNPWAKVERRISANLSNQFEWPVFFYAACVVVMVNQVTEPIYLWLAWIFVGGRFVHSGVQILTTNIRLRGVVFMINFLAVLGMWVMILLGLMI